MTSSSEAKLLEALKQVECSGDVGIGRGDDPTNMIMRHVALRDDLIRWDPEFGNYYLTSSGVLRLHRQRGRVATVTSLPLGRPRTRRVS